MSEKTIDVKSCGYVPEENKKQTPCDGVGKVMRTGDKAGMGIRYVKCQKDGCPAWWEVYFRKPPKEEIIARTAAHKAHTPSGDR